METVLGLVPIGEFFGLIIITLDFVKFNVNLLATIHLLTDEILKDSLLYKWFKVLSCKIKQVSSANSLGQSDVLLLMSLLYSVNNNGSRTEPCGTPQLIFLPVDCLLSKDPYWHLLDKKDENNLSATPRIPYCFNLFNKIL